MRRRALRARSMIVDAGGPLHAVDYGGDGIPLILVHGLGGSTLHWMSVAPLFAERHRVVSIDLPGFGRSPLAGRSPSLEANVTVVSRFARSLDEPAVMVGNSMGGLILMSLAALRPELVRGLVLVDPAVPRPLYARASPPLAWLYTAYLWPVLGEIVRSGRSLALGPDRAVRHTLSLAVEDPRRVAPEVLGALLAEARERSVDGEADRVYLRALRSVWRFLLTPGAFTKTVNRIATPTLLIQGERDKLIPVGAARRLARRRPDWRFELLEGLGHCPQLEDPKLFVEIVERWLIETYGVQRVLTTRRQERNR